LAPIKENLEETSSFYNMLTFLFFSGLKKTKQARPVLMAQTTPEHVVEK